MLLFSVSIVITSSKSYNCQIYSTGKETGVTVEKVRCYFPFAAVLLDIPSETHLAAAKEFRMLSGSIKLENPILPGKQNCLKSKKFKKLALHKGQHVTAIIGSLAD